MADLAALALGAGAVTSHGAARAGLRAARRESVLRAIDAHGGDPELSAASVAARLGVTPRYVHLLLEETGQTFSQHLLARRLDRALWLLRDQRQGHLRIGDIAGEAGFADLSYFNRSFRRRFGDTPSAVRARLRNLS
ncbi:helix-turn-helix transcriptional regulator [Vineibacter terrae]|nr:helix-turn-helix transcriptional regulator [Vineibacter terrae]